MQRLFAGHGFASNHRPSARREGKNKRRDEAEGQTGNQAP